MADTWPLAARSNLCPSHALAAALREPLDILHAHGLWQLPLIAAGRAATSQKKLIVAPRGMLHPAALAFSRWKKRAFDMLLQRRVVLGADLLHATSADELDDVRRYGYVGPVAVVPNGIEIPDLDAAPEAEPSQRVVTIGRIHPKKGLDRLLKAWARIEPAHDGWSLVIAGPDEGGHREELLALKARLGLRRVAIGGPVYGEEKTALYADAALFVLSTLGENFAMTVAESLAAGTPVVSTKGAPWEGLERERCGWWIEHGVEPLAATLAEAMALPAEARAAMGVRGRAWMARDFSWPALAADMAEAYRWLLGRGSKPDCVHV